MLSGRQQKTPKNKIQPRPKRFVGVKETWQELLIYLLTTTSLNAGKRKTRQSSLAACRHRLGKNEHRPIFRLGCERHATDLAAVDIDHIDIFIAVAV